MRAPLLLVLATITPFAPVQDRVSYADLLTAITDLDRLWRAPPQGERCIQFSSYDRRSHQGPKDADAWYANDDAGQFLRVEERGERKEHVMVDVAGAGSVVRIWSANPKGTLRFYVDAEDGGEPTWTIAFQDLCGGKKPPFVEPLAGVRSRGWNCHLPVPFARSLKVTCDQGGFYYQVNVRLFPAGTQVEPFRPELLAEHASRIDEIARALRAAGQPDGKATDEQGLATEAMTGDIELWRAQQDGVLRLLEVQLLDGEHAKRGARLVVTSGDETLVDVPLADFFASAPAMKPSPGQAIGVRPDGTGYCRFPMPLAAGSRVIVRADTPCRVAHRVRFEPRPLPADALRFRASWHLASRIPTRPFSDHLVLDAKGRGRFVGCTLHVANPDRPWWGEGDEKLFVDGEDFPSTFGTGTEDYFGYAWCSPKPFAHPLHGQPQCDGPANFGHTCVNRFQLADAVPFQKSFRFDLEVWYGARGRTREVDYATTAYWYAAPGASAGLPAVPAAEARQPRALELPKPWVAEGVLEAESLPHQVTRGKTRRQETAGFEGGRWSHDGQLWWTDAEAGDRLTLELPVEAAGRYLVKVRFTRAEDYGIVQAHGAGRELGAPIDLYHAGVVPTDEIELGEVELAKGKQPLVFAITGRNPQAVAKFMVGIDYVRLEKR